MLGARWGLILCLRGSARFSLCLVKRSVNSHRFCARELTNCELRKPLGKELSLPASPGTWENQSDVPSHFQTSRSNQTLKGPSLVLPT